MAGPSSNLDIRTVEISIAGYDLADPEHAETVSGKIDRAAKRACGYSLARQTPRERMEERVCRDDAIARAVTQLDEPVLTLVMNAENGVS